MTNDYIWYDKCDCGGGFEGMDGIVLDSYPSSYPVKCTKCGTESNTALMIEAKDMGWPKPKWKQLVSEK